MRHNYHAMLAVLFSLLLVAPAMAQDMGGEAGEEFPLIDDTSLTDGGDAVVEHPADQDVLVIEDPAVIPAAAEDADVDGIDIDDSTPADLVAEEDPLVHVPTIEEPANIDALTEESVDIDTPVAEEPIDMDAPVAEEPVNLDALTEEPIDIDALTEESVDIDALTEESVDIDALVAEEPVNMDALTEEPVNLDTPPAAEEDPFAFTMEEVPEGDRAMVEPSSAPMANPPVGIAGLEGDVDLLLRAEKMKRQAYETHLHDTLASGGIALKENRLEDAIKIYEEAIRLVKSIGDRPENRPEKEAGQAGLAEALYRRAAHLYENGDLDQAAEYARRSVALGHELAPALISRITEDINRPPPQEKVKSFPRWRDPDYLKESADIDELLKKGREHFAAGELDNAKIMFKTVLSRDPENTEAIRMLQKVGERSYDVANAETIATRTEMIANVKRAYNPRDYELSAEKKDMMRDFTIKTPQTIDSDRLRITAKMERIQIPEIDFRQANIHDVIDFLQEASVEFDDKAPANEARGVNVILNLSTGAEQQGTRAPEDPFAAVTGEQNAPGDTIPLITFSARYISLYEALRIVTDVANLKFRVTGSVVMVVRQDAPDTELVHRMYDVLPSVGEKIEQVMPELGRGGRGGGGGDFISLEGSTTGSARGDWKDFFENLGVGWPRGTSIKYIPTIGKIIVKNTPENLTIFEKVLSVLNVVPYQIEIEARFVEASQDDVDSLGFEWNLTDDWELAHKTSDPSQRISIGAGSLTSGLRFGGDLSTDGTGGTDDTLLTVSSLLTNPEVSFVLHALEQRGNTDLLSAPKVTTQSGLEATLKVVTEYIYPTSFLLQNNSVSGNPNLNVNVQNNVPIAVPEDFETREVGVILSVLPEVSPEGQMINLTMSPEVVSEPEWFNYGAKYRDQNGNEVEVNMPQPFFRTRSIQTSISIYNGATVVMGGLITESRSTTEDKVPLLGDLPLIGRIFRSTVERSQKRNLLIFVTARLVDPSGRPAQQTGSSVGGALVEGALIKNDG